MPPPFCWEGGPMKKKHKQGFTLIELMVVIAVIGILAALAIPQMAGFRRRAIRVGMVSDVRNATSVALAVHTAQQTYANLNPSPGVGPASVNISTLGIYPTNLSKNDILTFSGLGVDTFTAAITNTRGDDGVRSGPVSIDQNGQCAWTLGGAC